MAVTVMIDGNRVFRVLDLSEELGPSGHDTVGQWADALARANGVGGSDGESMRFSFKVNGDVASRDYELGDLPDDDEDVDVLLELIDVTEPDEVVPASEPVALSEAEGGSVPDGTVDEVLDWVRGSEDHATWTEGWGDRAQAALTVERAKGDDARKGVTEPLERAIAEAADQAEAEAERLAAEQAAQ